MLILTKLWTLLTNSYKKVNACPNKNQKGSNNKALVFNPTKCIKQKITPIFLQQIDIHTHKQQQMFKRVSNQMINANHHLGIPLNHLIKLLSKNPNHPDGHGQQYHIPRVVVGDVSKVVGLVLGGWEFVVREDASDVGVEVALETPVDEE